MMNDNAIELEKKERVFFFLSLFRNLPFANIVYTASTLVHASTHRKSSVGSVATLQAVMMRRARMVVPTGKHHHTMGQ